MLVKHPLPKPPESAPCAEEERVADFVQVERAFVPKSSVKWEERNKMVRCFFQFFDPLNQANIVRVNWDDVAQNRDVVFEEGRTSQAQINKEDMMLEGKIISRISRAKSNLWMILYSKGNKGNFQMQILET